MTDEESYLQVARHAGLGETTALVRRLHDLHGAPHQIVSTLLSHHMMRLVLLATTEADLRAALPVALVDSLETWRARAWTSNATLLRLFDAVATALAADAVPVLLLKGFVFAERLYGGLERRPQHDVDLLVRAADLRRVRRRLAALGFVRRAYDAHAETFVRGDTKFDVHWCLRRAPAFNVDEQAIWDEAVDVHIAGLPCRTLSDEWHLVLLTLTTFEEIGHGMAKLKGLLDLYLLARSVDAQIDWERFFRRRERERLHRIAVNVLALVTEMFAARDDLPHLEAALEARRRLTIDLSGAERLRLVFAPQRSPANLSWFARIYPGSLTHYLVRFWAAGFPYNARRFSPRRLMSSAGVAWRLRASQRHR